MKTFKQNHLTWNTVILIWDVKSPDSQHLSSLTAWLFRFEWRYCSKTCLSTQLPCVFVKHCFWDILLARCILARVVNQQSTLRIFMMLCLHQPHKSELVGGRGIINDHDSSRNFNISETLSLTSFALQVCLDSWLISRNAATLHISHRVKNFLWAHQRLI